MTVHIEVHVRAGLPRCVPEVPRGGVTQELQPGRPLDQTTCCAMARAARVVRAP